MFLRLALARLEISVWSSSDIQKGEKIIVYYIVRCIIRNLLKLMYSVQHVLSFKLSLATFKLSHGGLFATYMHQTRYDDECLVFNVRYTKKF